MELEPYDRNNPLDAPAPPASRGHAPRTTAGRPRSRRLPTEVYGRVAARGGEPPNRPHAPAAYGGAGDRPEAAPAAREFTRAPKKPPEAEPAPAAPAHHSSRALRVGLKISGVLLVMLISLLGLAFGAITVICKGPSPTAMEMFVVSVEETSAVKFLSRIYFTEDKVQAILQKNTVLVMDEVTDTTAPFEPAIPDKNVPDLEIIDVSGSTFKGKLMLIRDPSRVRLAALPQFGDEVSGRKIEEFVADNGAIAGINAGGFLDLNGVGKGGQPLGLLICDGVIRSGSTGTSCNVIGLTYDNQLIVGEMTGQQALDMGVRDAVHFTPTLIVNGKAAEVSGTGGGVNPRTCIGQRADGTIMFLVIDGRQPHSIGATLQDCIDLMLEYEAVNAANLDGGSSSVMVYEGELINVCSSLYGSRNQPAAFIVER